MSILDALRVQRGNQESIADLALLPQNEIIRLAQMGQISATMVPVIINEKARMAKEAANLRAAAQAQGGMPTVIEQAMQTNAQAETGQGVAPQMPQMPQGGPPGVPPAAPQGAPQAQQPMGLAGLPTGDMFKAQNFEAGGIVAFNGENDSLVDGDEDLMAEDAGESTLMLRGAPIPGPSHPPPKVQKVPGRGPASLDEFIKQYQSLTAEARKETPEEKAYLEAIKKGSLSSKDVQDQKYLRLLQAGLGIMGGESPYAFTNIGRGSQEALKGYAEDIKAQQAQKMLDLKAAAETARGKRSEALQDIQGGAGLYEKYLDREQRKEIAKESQLGAKYADNYLATRRAGGDKRPDEVIKNEGYREFFQLYGFASGRAATQAGIAAGAQGVQAAGIAERYANQAQDSVDKILGKISSPEARQYRKLQKDDPSGASAAQYRQELINQRAAELAAAAQAPGAPGAPGAGAKPAPAAPAASANAVPLPAKQSDLKDGTVYQTARGPAKWSAKDQKFYPVQ